MDNDNNHAFTTKVHLAGLRRCLFAFSFLNLVGEPVTAAPDDWVAYLRGPRHSSFNASATAFTPATAKHLRLDWSFTAAPPTEPDQPDAGFNASPTVANGVIYIGANTGMFYALDEATGAELWRRSLGYSSAKSCPGRGITSTATVIADPNRSGQLIVYVGGGDGFLYALRASDGQLVWRRQIVDIGTTENTGYNWASPTVIGGHVYMGISSDCDNPLVRGGIKEFDQASGALLGTYWSVPAGAVGGSVWTSPASDGRYLWATIGNSPESSTEPLGDCFGIVRLDAATLRQVDRWIVTPSLAGTDLDWGSSPTLFNAVVNGMMTRLVGAANKNGKYYAFEANDLAAGPLWSPKLGANGGDLRDKGILIAASIWDSQNNRLVVGANQTKISGSIANGSVRRLNPATGATIWETPLTGGAIMGSPTLSGGGVIAAATYNIKRPGANAVYLLDAENGAMLNIIPQAAPIFSQPVFARDHLLVATTSGVLAVYTTQP